MANYNKVLNGVFYQLIVGTFADSNGDGIGDIKGLTQKLDYLNDGHGGGLGVTGIWLCPMYPSYTYHKYDANDYFGVDPDYGSVEDVANLVAEAKKRGISILIDLVFNCVASTNPIFLDALHNTKSKYRDFFYFYNDVKDKGYDLNSVWNTLPSWQTASTAHGEEKYIGIYHAIMPDLNFHNPKVREYCKDVASFWLKTGVSGFRLDSAMHLFSCSEVTDNENYHDLNEQWWKEFYEHCKGIKPDVYLVGEVWEKAEVRAQYMRAMKSDFHFFLGESIGVALSQNKDDGQRLKNYLKDTYAEYRRQCGSDYMDAPFLSNHDESRYYGTCVFSDEDARLAASIYLMLEGRPFIYYGEELGFKNYNVNAAKTKFDWFNSDSFLQARTSFLWGKGDSYQTKYIYFDEDKYLSPDSATQEADKNSFYNHYKNLIRLRGKFSAIGSGSFNAIDYDDARLLCYEMLNENSSVIVIHNISAEQVSLANAYGKKEIYYIDSGETRKAEGAILKPKKSYICF